MKRWLACAAGLILISTAVCSRAEIPGDTLVMAWQFDDIITLDPAEIFEFSGAEYAANTYDRLIGYDIGDVSRIRGEAAESWTVSDDGKTYTFRIRDGISFTSGNPLTARDAAFSLHRLILLNKSPAFILSQFGYTPENVREKIRASDDRTLVMETDKVYAPTFLLYCLTATVGSVVDMNTVMTHEQDGDMGHAWLRTRHAGSGPFHLKSWKAGESIFLDRNDRYWKGPSRMRRVILRHIAEPATQRLLLEKGDVDIARNLGPDQIAGITANRDIVIQTAPKGGLFYLGLNQKHEVLKHPGVRQALKYLVDYEGIAGTILKGAMVVHQAFLPRGFLGALEEKPFSLDVKQARALLAEAGYPEGFAVSMDVRNAFPTIDMAQSIQSTFALAGVKVEILPMDAKQAITKYRARNHEIHIGRWGPDYQDPHTNAGTFAANPDNADDADAKTLAWRNAWDIPDMTRKTAAAVVERDPVKRARMYLDLQKEHQAVSPFVILFQDIETAACRANVKQFVLGPSFDSNVYRLTEKE
ncbi:ABC transporter substrate-binding protein [Desulfococcus sp.]|uniref:ABC transporter substrate-binding protein n=1 Tax=Desulfococcus sp. TaxID=2025834 RepID=UPI00359310BD